MKNYIDQVHTLEMLSEAVAQVRREGHDVYSKEEVAKLLESIYGSTSELEVRELPDTSVELDDGLTESQINGIEDTIKSVFKDVENSGEDVFDLELRGNEIEVNIDWAEIRRWIIDELVETHLDA